MPFTNKRNQGFSEKWLILGLGLDQEVKNCSKKQITLTHTHAHTQYHINSNAEYVKGSQKPSERVNNGQS